jgi:hypothetical protein
MAGRNGLGAEGRNQDRCIEEAELCGVEPYSGMIPVTVSASVTSGPDAVS